MAGFSVNIGADITQLTTGLNQAAAEVQKFNNNLASTPTQSLAPLNNVINATIASFDELAASAAALNKIEAAIDQAAAAATSAGARFDTLGGRLPLQDFNTFKTAVDNLKTDISSGLVPQISRIPNAINPITPAAEKAAGALNKIRPGANQAAQSLTNVGRIAQDLPFGFIGIQNNLNPLLESFQRLKAETGSGSAALKALGSSLIGPAGIGIALSVISSAILIYQNGIAGFNQKTKEAKDKAEEFAKTLKTVADVIGDATSGQAGGIAQVQALASVVQNTNAAYDQRKRALQELQQINKSYFGDLKLEESQMSILTDRVNEYSKAIVAQAVLKGFTDEISRVSVELAKQNRVLKGNADEVNRLRTALENAKQSETSLTGEERISAKYVKIKSALDDANKAFAAQSGIVNNLQTNYDQLNGEIDGAVKNTLNLRDLNDPTKQKAEVDILKKRLEALEKIKAITKDATALVGLQEAVFELQVKIAIRDQGKNQLTKQELDQQVQGFKAELQKAFENQALELEAIPKVKFSPTTRLDIQDIIKQVFTSKEKITLTLGENGIQVRVKKESVDVSDLMDKVSKATGFDKKIPIITLREARIKILGVKLTEKVEFQEKISKELNDALNDSFKNLKIDAISGVADALGEALAGGDIQNVFKSLFSIIASGLQQFGKALIAYGVAQKALQLASKSLNPTIAIVAGAALIIAGSALRASLPKFATGGIVSGPLIGQIGEMHRPEVIMPLDRLPQMLRSIGGGGGNDMQFIPIINNEGLYLAVQRGARRTGRKF